MMRALAVLAFLTFLYLLGPILVVVGSALGDTDYLAFPPHGLTLKWFQAALAEPRYLHAFVTSLGIAGAATVFSLLLGLHAAFALARYAFPGRRLVEAALLMPLVLPALVLSIALTLMFSRIGFTAGSARLIVAHLVICTPYVVRVALPVLQRLDPAQEEAARSLGASAFSTFFLVTLPAMRPGAIAAATLPLSSSSFDEIDLAIFLAPTRARRRCR